MKSHLIKKNQTKFLLLLILSIVILIFISHITNAKESRKRIDKYWEFQSIDTMKYSRDLSREKLNDPRFDVVIDRQLKQISSTGATYVAIATPYDPEFLPILKRWVNASRKYNLKVWFRGNFSGWEGWFDYKKIDRPTHTQLIVNFIKNNPELFIDGDVFSSCPECENGGPGDPRHNKDISGHRNFLINEFQATSKAFTEINKKVSSNYNSMNGDVATLIMDKETTRKLGGIVVIDHYVKSPEQLNEDISRYAAFSGGKIVLGEFGAPIPDIHGKMSEIEQKEWLEQTMLLLAQNNDLIGVNYWTSSGGSTELWDSVGNEKAAVNILKQFFNPYETTIMLRNSFGNKIKDAVIVINNKTLKVDSDEITLPTLTNQTKIRIEAYNYKPINTIVKSGKNVIILRSINPSFAEELINIITNRTH